MEGEKGGAALFSDQGSFEEYIDMLLHNAKMLAVTDRLEIFPSWAFQSIPQRLDSGHDQKLS